VAHAGKEPEQVPWLQPAEASPDLHERIVSTSQDRPSGVLHESASFDGTAKPEVGEVNSRELPKAMVSIVLGRECEGLTDAEVAVCDAVCSIPMSRMQESLSLSHAVTVVLSQLFQSRLECMSPPCRSQYTMVASSGPSPPPRVQ
jgi:tRNA C32,U32 (ribose-2'-O)-methylase TrmJ